MINLNPMNFGSTPAPLLNISFDTNNDGIWDYHAIVDLAKPSIRNASPSILDLLQQQWQQYFNKSNSFRTLSSRLSSFQGEILSLNGNSQISIKDEIYGPLDTLETSTGETTASIDLVQVPFFGSIAGATLALFGMLILLAVFRRE